MSPPAADALRPTFVGLFFPLISISISIGNSNFPCKSHYWIEDNRVRWEARMTPQLTALSRDRDKAAKAREYGHRDQATGTPPLEAAANTHAENARPKLWWHKLLDWLR